MSSTTQELRLGPEDPALLDLLRSFDLGTPRARDPALPLAPNSLARHDRSCEPLPLVSPEDLPGQGCPLCMRLSP